MTLLVRRSAKGGVSRTDRRRFCDSGESVIQSAVVGHAIKNQPSPLY
ncbi:hypothetical protein BN903_32 [Halorubrum sp. AJ67]|nr:hypothetical protein BN903_32 [Halorubrum sp. AJ67]